MSWRSRANHRRGVVLKVTGDFQSSFRLDGPERAIGYVGNGQTRKRPQRTGRVALRFFLLES